MIRDLKDIKKLARLKENENWEFRSWLKFYAPSQIDSIVKKLSQKYAGLIDCKECANCCQSLNIVVDKKTTKQLSEKLGLSSDVFQDRYTFVDDEKDRLLKTPCPMLNNKLCSIYTDRPDTCRTFPHLEKSGFLSRLIGIIGSLSVCPIAYNSFEELKVITKWKSR